MDTLVLTSNLHALRAAFLPEQSKAALETRLRSGYGAA